MAYLRDLLVSCGALPAVDKQLREFQAWLDRRLEDLAGHPHLRLLRQFGLWHQLPGMRARAAAGPLRTTAAQYARSRFIQAQAFLTWTDALGVRPSALTQAHIDAYYASHASHQREGVRAFLVWAAGHGHIPGHLDIPRQQPYAGQAITQQRRLDLLRRFATDEAIPIRPRAAACLMLLYAQPLSRILRLSAADLSRDDDGQTWLRLGDPPSPVPAPFGALLHQLAATRHDHVPANHGSDWLFPGRHAGQPAAYRPMAAQLREHGLPLRTARISALRQLVLQVPAPVIAGALGFHHTTTTRQHVNAAGPGAGTPAATANPDHTGCRALPAGQGPGRTASRTGPGKSSSCGSASVQPGPLVRLALLDMVTVDRAAPVELDAAGSVDANPEQVVLAVLPQSEDDLDGHPLTVQGGYTFIQAIIEHGHPPVRLCRRSGKHPGPR